MVERLFGRLEVLLAALCRDAGVRLEPSDHWAYDWSRRVILVSRESLVADGMDVCAGILAHEIGHYFISCDHWLQFEGIPPGMRQLLTNTIEDLRVETWMGRRYPGASRWFELINCRLVKRQGLEFLPSFCRYCYGSAAGWQGDGVDAKCLGESVAEALSVTWEDRQTVASIVPDSAFDKIPLNETALEQFQSLIQPRLSDKAPSGLSAADIWSLLSADAAYRVAEKCIFPMARKLYDSDVLHIGRFIAADNSHREAAHKALAGVFEKLQKFVGSAMRWAAEEFDRVPREDLDLAGLVLDTFYLKGNNEFYRMAGSSTAGTQSCRSYQNLVAQVYPQVNRLAGALEEAFRPRQRMRLKPACPQGSYVNLRALMAYNADPRHYDRLWERKLLPDPPEVAFLLLVDLSGSMSGEKVEAAVKGTVLLLEVLERLQMPRAVFGFQDVLIPFVNFDERLGEKQKKAIAHMPFEVSGNRPGGNNRYKYNDDGPCLLEAAEMLLSQRVQDHCLLVISDGRPEGKRSNEKALHQAVKKLGQESSLTLIGLGLGPHTEHVREFYPRHIANIPVRGLAERLGGLVRETLLS